MIDTIITAFVLLLGFSIILFGLIIWKNQKLSFIHGKNKANVKEEDIKEYTEAIGKSYIILGISELGLPLSKLFSNDALQFILFLICTLIFIFSIVKVAKTQKKYKTGMWS